MALTQLEVRHFTMEQQCNLSLYHFNLLQSIWWNSPQGVEALPTDLESLSDTKLCVGVPMALLPV